MEKSQEQILRFNESYSGEESKRLLWKLLKCSISGNMSKLRSAERQDLLTFYEQLCQLLDAVSCSDRPPDEQVKP